MIKGLSHAGIFVLDQDSALDFYVNKLGFEVRDDVRMDNGYRWLTVGTKQQPGMRVVLSLAGPPMLDEETAASVRALIAKGSLGAGVLVVDDCRVTYEELVGRGVTFLQEPAERPYGIEALLRDDSGNWWSMTERRSP
jgi:catechol 2,3-dioxygenase-like lactoylglutathione lyase family enzyme